MLKLLEKHDYPYAEELEVRARARWFDGLLGHQITGQGEYRTRHYFKAAWRIGGFEFGTPHDRERPSWVGQLYLLSDGRIYCDRVSTYAFGFVSRMWSPCEGRNFDNEALAETVLLGLRNLAAKA